MTPEERQLLTGLFERIGAASGAPRDREAEAFIADAVRVHPYAPYMMAQTVLVQEEALKAAAARIAELEARAAEMERAGQEPTSFLGGISKSLFGEPPRRTGSGVPAVGPGDSAPGGVWNRGPSPGYPPPPPAPPNYAPSAGFGQGPWGGQPASGGFLRSAMATAAGVAGGALLYQGIESLMHSHGGGGLTGGSALAGDLGASGTGLGSLAGTGLDDPNLMTGGSRSHAADILGGQSDDLASHPDAGDDDTFDVASDDGGGDVGGDDGGDWA
ncbi:DUF2076 domain-containing protein [Alsobacter sp. SYSU M60028]|uniref:DUF2076 domain-containing protein n=1 Tax=Alsobacter ponti TaxID=2962936 RepID=A0ABT1LCC7_9HYPH|nr:DUF2076 domain-containing protein [Alsobacter ponti]MCP8939165.1 DUF2076 domain-containing protein [Alsobacter ponti]